MNDSSNKICISKKSIAKVNENCYQKSIKIQFRTLSEYFSHSFQVFTILNINFISFLIACYSES